MGSTGVTMDTAVRLAVILILTFNQINNAHEPKNESDVRDE